MVIIAPYAKQLFSNKINPKNYPYWKDLIKFLPELDFVQVGVEGEEQLIPDFRKNLKLDQLRNLIRECDFWISVDSFFQHLAYDEKKTGFVIWGPSDPRIFGYKENFNVLKSRQLLSPNQFLMWEQQAFDTANYVSAQDLAELIRQKENLLDK